MTTENWNFSEYDNYICYQILYKDPDEPERFFYIKNHHDKDLMHKHANIMAFLDVFTTHFQRHVLSNKKLHENKCLKLFVNTDHTFYELHKNPHFQGVNKPKNVHFCRNAEHDIGKDGRLRAHNRSVMIIIPHTYKQLYDLYCHEITHTLCNHVQFRTDDHHGITKEDFPYCENIVRKITKELKLLEYLERLYA